MARNLLIRRVYFAPGSGDAGKTLLDFGCGDGSFLERVEGKVARRLGFEPSACQANAVSARLGIPVASDLADSTTVPDGSVDIVTSHFVLEHLTDLWGTFAYWHRILRPRGSLHLAVPNIDCFEARLFGRRWHGLDAPRHVSFPAGRSLEWLAAKSGFKVIRRGTGVFPNTWGASLVAAALGRHHQALFMLLMPLAFVLAFLMPHSTTVYELRKEA
ncbi:MAG: class I SAM-dependent methyltransferase [Acidobacteria bacterium]|nr:class I SAM-dependent methyltransferase [Acidobacteriota bacterium]